jgi:transketolase
MLRHAVDVAESLRARDGVHARVLSMHTVKPLDDDAIVRALAETGAVITVEEHNVGSGLGAAVAQVAASHTGPRGSFRAFGVPDEPYTRVGSLDYMREMLGDLRSVVIDVLRAKRRVA